MPDSTSATKNNPAVAAQKQAIEPATKDSGSLALRTALNAAMKPAHAFIVHDIADRLIKAGFDSPDAIMAAGIVDIQSHFVSAFRQVARNVHAQPEHPDFAKIIEAAKQPHTHRGVKRPFAEAVQNKSASTFDASDWYVILRTVVHGDAYSLRAALENPA